MDREIKSILQIPTVLGREGRYIVRDGLARNEDLSEILARLPLVERFRLYAFLTNSRDPEIEGMTPDAFYTAVSTIGNSINFKENDALSAAVQSVIGKTQLREKRPIPSDNKNGFDEYQSSSERYRQLYLAYVVSVFLPEAVIQKKLNPEDQPLSDKLGHFANKNFELGEDLIDFSFVIERRREIDKRKQSKEAQRTERQEIASQLIAHL